MLCISSSNCFWIWAFSSLFSRVCDLGSRLFSRLASFVIIIILSRKNMQQKQQQTWCHKASPTFHKKKGNPRRAMRDHKCKNHQLNKANFLSYKWSQEGQCKNRQCKSHQLISLLIKMRMQVQATSVFACPMLKRVLADPGGSTTYYHCELSFFFCPWSGQGKVRWEAKLYCMWKSAYCRYTTTVTTNPIY